MSTAFELLVLETGETWALYGNKTAGAFFVNGFTQGMATINGSSFTTTAAKDYGVTPAADVAVYGTITTSAVEGVVAGAGRIATFSGAALSGSTYDYNVRANLSQVVGSWGLRSLDGQLTAVTVSSTGAITGNAGGCLFTGAVAPRPSGKNVFDVNVVSGPAPCRAPGTAYTGIAVTYAIAGTQLRELVVTVKDATATSGNAFFGVR